MVWAADDAELTDVGFLVVKFWLAISRDEQARRFEARANVPVQQQITDEDWRNREKWEQ